MKKENTNIGIPSPWDLDNKNPKDDLMNMFPNCSEHDEGRIIQICTFLQKQANYNMLDNLLTVYGKAGVSYEQLLALRREIMKR